MPEYLKILISIILAIISIAIFFSAIALVFEAHSYYINEKNNLTFGLGIVWIVAWFGFLLFGITGSILWRLYFAALSSWSGSFMRKHVYSSLLSGFTCTSFFALTQFNQGITEVVKIYAILILVLPVIFASLIIYRKCYASNRT
jgi:hypothetical protein